MTDIVCLIGELLSFDDYQEKHFVLSVVERQYFDAIGSNPPPRD